MSTENFLPPINTNNNNNNNNIRKHHRLNTEKAVDQTNKNFLACHDSGTTSEAYRVNENNVTESVI
jgi:hypothetical protein